LKDRYLQAQKTFWNVDESTARFGRVDTVSRSEAEYDRLAERDVTLVLQGINPQQDWIILEIGCGVGRLLRRIVPRLRPAKAIGVDISENMIRYARTALEHLKDVELLSNSGADLSMISESSINFVYSNDVFIHIHDPEVVRSYFREVSRVLKPGGGVFRFNIRRMEIKSAFANSPGGLLAKFGYMSGMLSPLSRVEPQPGFSGIHYRKRDVQQLVRAARLWLTSIERLDGPYEQKFWCTCFKP
jgi:ubiquinone/menaquinone biosynthesis C-methylase UbiE